MPSSALKKKMSSDRKSTRLNSSHLVISYAVCCLKKKNHLEDPPVVPRGDGHAARHEAVADLVGLECVVERPPFEAELAVLFFFNDPAAAEIYTLSHHDVLAL